MSYICLLGVPIVNDERVLEEAMWRPYYDLASVDASCLRGWGRRDENGYWFQAQRHGSESKSVARMLYILSEELIPFETNTKTRQKPNSVT